MLANERYVGRFTWNQSKWIRVPGRKSRRRIMRAREEWITHDIPELAIIPRKLWEDVQSRFRRRRSAGSGRP
jgi:site-specific DNA recombinase